MIITGDPTQVSNSLQRTVNGATNASPIVISTTASHGFADGDTVVVSGVGGNTAANGTWTIDVLTGTTFALVGAVGSGAYTSGGSATDVSLTPAFDYADDGDNLDAASVGVAIECLADRTQQLNSRIGTIERRLQLVDLQHAAADSPGLGISLTQGTLGTQTVSVLSAGVATEVGDIVEVFLSAYAGLQLASGGSPANLGSALVEIQNGGGDNVVPGSTRFLRGPVTTSGAEVTAEMTSAGSFVIATAGTLEIRSTWFFQLGGNTGDTAFAADYSAVMKIWRLG